MINRMEFPLILKDKDLILQASPPLTGLERFGCNGYFGPLRTTFFGNIEDLASRNGALLADAWFGEVAVVVVRAEIRKRRGQSDGKPLYFCP